MSTGILNIYAQRTYHDPVYVAGDTAGLRALRDAIDGALRAARGTAKAFASDGEGFGVVVVDVPTPDASRLLLPYTGADSRYRRDRGDVLTPWDVALHAS